MNQMDKIIAKQFPPLDYEVDRATHGHMEPVRLVRSRALAEGVSWQEWLYRRGDGADVWVYLTKIAAHAPVQLAVAAAPLWTSKRVTTHAKDFEEFFGIPVLYAMNASFFHFFNNGDLTPYGIQVVRGVEMARPGIVKDKPWYGYNFLAVDKAGKAFISNAEAYNAHLRGKLEYAVGGGMRLIREEKVYLYEDPLGKGFMPAPRTAVGFDTEGNTILLCADGRSKRSAGLTLADIIDIYRQQGRITELLNLDGGGSTTVVLKDEAGNFRVENVPSGTALPVNNVRYDIEKKEPQGDEMVRAVADALLIIPKQNSKEISL